MARPADGEWKPLGLDSDPVPGDPTMISQEAQHLSKVATTITNQVAALRKIAAAGDEIGKHADEIRSSASELAGELDKVVGRYHTVSSALNDWIPDLEKAQSMSLQALNDAEGPYQKINQEVALPGGSNLTAQQKKAVSDYHTAMKKAQGDLEDAVTLLHKATQHRDDRGSYYAGLINKACDDSMKDSWWDKFKDFVSKYAWLIKDICTVLEIAATIAAIVAFVLAFVVVQFVPGLDVLVDGLVVGAFIATGVATAGRLLLAATGNGSWLDFAIDAFTLATFGIGRLMGSLAKGLVAGTELASKSAMAAELADAVMQESPRGMMLLKYAMMQGVPALEMAGRVAEFAPSLAEDAESLEGGLKIANALGSLGEEGNTFAKIISLSERFTNGFADLSGLGDAAKLMLTISGTTAGVAGGLGVVAPVLGGVTMLGPGGSSFDLLHIPGVNDWWEDHLADPMTGAISTGAANVAADVLTVVAPPIGLPLQAYRFTHGGG